MADLLTSIRSSSSAIIGIIIALPVVLIIGVAIWLSSASLVENMHFAHATGQVLGIVAAGRDYAGREKNFVLQPGEDLLASLARVGTVTDITTSSTPAHLTNSWGGTITASAPTSSTMRLELKVPVRDCRRLAIFFAKDAASLALEIMEAREGGSSVWRRFLDDDEKTLADSRPIEAACGDAPEATLALVFRIH